MIELKWKLGGFRQIRSADGVRRELESYGRSMAARANAQLRGGHEGFFVASHEGKRAPYGRWQVKVVAGSPYAKRHNAKHQTLLRILGSR